MTQRVILIPFSKDIIIVLLCLRIHICLQMESRQKREEWASCHVTHHILLGGAEET